MSGAAPHWRAAMVMTLLLTLTAAVYYPGLFGPLLLDDHQVLSPLLNIPPQQLFSKELLLGYAGPTGRPLAMLSFAADAALHGDQFVWWKTTNLALHLAAGWLIYLLVAALFCVRGSSLRGAQVAAALVAGAWLLHPLQVSTVLYTVQRMTQLATLGCLLGLLAYVHGRRRMLADGSGAGWIVAAVGIATPLAGLAKETGLMLPLYIVALEFTLFAPQSRPPWLRRLLAACWLIPLIAGVGYFATDLRGRVLNAYHLRDFSARERLLTEARILVTYLRWIVLPRRADFGFYHDDEPVARDLSDAGIVPSIALLAAVPILAWRCRRRFPLSAFGVALFALGHVLESSIFGLELMYEHRNYLPMLGVLLIVAEIVATFAPPRGASIAGAALLVALAAATFPRTLIWGDEAALYQTFMRLHPHSERARVTLAEWYLGRGEFDAAERVVVPVTQMTFAVEAARIHCLRDGALDARDVATLKRVRDQSRIDTFAYDALLFLATAVLDGQCSTDVPELLLTLEAMRRMPISVTPRYRLHIYLGMLYFARGDPALAFERVRRASALQPNDPYVHYLMAEWAHTLGDAAAADAALAAARARDGTALYPMLDRRMQGMPAPK